MEIFNITLEFDHEVFRKSIEKCVADNGKGYVCVVDGNVLSVTCKDSEYRKVVKNALVNTCDSSYIARMASSIYGEKFEALSGPRIFEEYIGKPYRQLLLGNTEETYKKIAKKLCQNGDHAENLEYIPIPFTKVEEFDYEGIATEINKIKPDLIWVSLGAPKQERFMGRMLPYLEQGVMFGIGAAFNYYVGSIREPKLQIGPQKLIWLQRIFEEPKKQIRRCSNFLTVIPKVRREEIRRVERMQKK